MTTTAETHGFNAVNRGVYLADNLDFLRALNDECIDLVCIDPPFDKNDTFPADRLNPPLTEPERQNELRLLAHWGVTTPEQADDRGLEWPPDNDVRGGFKDIWRWENDIHQEWLDTLESAYPDIHSLIETTRLIHGNGRAAYLCFMAVRLLEIHRVLKPAGSLYLHCDSDARSYLNQLLNAVFGTGENNGPGLRNEIVWRSTSAHSDARRYGANTETIFFYTKGREWTWNQLYTEYDAAYKARFRYSDPDGRAWTDDNLSARGLSGGGYRYEYKGATDLWRLPLETMQRLDAEGRLHFTSRGGIRRKRYLDEMPGRAIQQLWDDIPPLNSQARERAGYPTQKPVALAERIIAASTNPGDVVLDCFAGCAYVPVAAERLGRQWVACDFNPRAWTVFKRQFNKPQLALLCCNDDTTGQQVLASEPTVTIHGPDELPVRTSPERIITLEPFTPPPRRFKKRALMTDEEMLNELLTLSRYQAWCCGFANRREDGTIIRQDWNFHLDHIDPKAAGGINEIINRAPMCPHHNIRKSNQLVALREYRNQIADAGEMMVSSAGDLIDLGWAQSQVLEIHARYFIQRRPQQTQAMQES